MRAALRLFMICTMILAPADFRPAFAAPEAMREIKIGVAVDPGFKEIRGWEEKFKQRLAYASQIFQREFKIKLVAAAFWDWSAKSQQKGLHYLLDELMQTQPLHGVDLVIGLTRMPAMPDMAQIQDLDVLGLARPFSGYLVIRYPNNPLFRVQEETVLAHELGHVFGAIHTEDPGSIMAPIVEKQIPDHFDNINRDVVLLTRNMNFKGGLPSLDPQTTQQLIGSYLKLMVYKQPLDFYYMLGIFYLNMNNRAEALKAWERASDLDDENPQIHFDLGMLYSRLGHHQRAIKELGRAVSGFSMAWQRPRKAQALAALGEAYLKQENYLAAYNALSRAAAIEPDNVDIKINLALVQLKRGQPKTAIKELRAVLNKNEGHARAYSYLGSAYFETGQYPEALQNLQQALRLTGTNPKSPAEAAILFEIYSNLGAVYLKLPDPEKALASYQAACHTFPSLTCHLQLGNLSFQLGKWQDAVREYASVIQEEPNNSNVYGPLGVALSQSGQDERALSVFQEGLRYADEDSMMESQLRSNIAHLYLRSGHPDFAEKEFRLALSANWKNIDAHLGLANAYVKRNNLEGASQSLRMVLNLNPKHEKARKLLADIERTMKETSQPTEVSFRPKSAY